MTKHDVMRLVTTMQHNGINSCKQLVYVPHQYICLNVGLSLLVVLITPNSTMNLSSLKGRFHYDLPVCWSSAVLGGI